MERSWTDIAARAETAYMEICMRWGQARALYLAHPTRESASVLDDLSEQLRPAGEEYLRARLEADCERAGLGAPLDWQNP